MSSSSFIVSASASYRYWFGRRGGVRSESGFPCARAGVGTSSGCRQIGSASSVADVTTISVGAQLIPVDKVSLSVGFAWIGLRGHKLTTACLDDGTVLTADNPVCFGDGSDTHLRSQTVFSLSAGYDIRDYLTLRLNFVTLALHPDRDGSRENPIWNELSTISLTAVFRVGGFVASRRADADDLQ